MNITIDQLNLIKRLQNPNDHQAWLEFDKAYRLLIYNSALYYDIPAQDAEDFTQTLLLKLWSKIAKFQYDSKKGEFKSWLKRVIYNSAMDFHRNTYKELRKLENYPESSEESELEIRVKKEWENYILSRVLKSLKSQISGKALKVFQMCLEGRKFSDISAQMNVNENTIYQLKRRVKNKIIGELKLLES